VQAFNRAEINGGTVHSDEEVYSNGFYQVNLRKLPGGWISLAVKRLDKEAVHDWRDLQQIKNLLCGAESEALELYPAESRLVDSCNQYYLWVLPPGDKFPFGFAERFIVKGHKGGYMRGSGQRDFREDEQPKDAIDSAEADKLAEDYIKKTKQERERI